MCGRYALGLRATFIRHHMRDNGMPVDDAPEDDEVRETYNFAPGNIGLVYRADTPPSGAGGDVRYGNGDVQQDADNEQAGTEAPKQPAQDRHGSHKISNATTDSSQETKYKLQPMKWGLVPFWTKRDPGYGGLMKTINARDDSLASNGGMWNSMKKTKRCIVVAQGFYEWLKKDGGKTKIPHFVKRKDGELMCFAGLWDCVQYEGRDERLWTYTVITTDSNQQLGFLHDRMPVILDNGSEDLKKWLDPKRTEWKQELQDLLKPYKGELECYPVNKDVGKVGNNSPDFIVPVDSADNKSNIANFFGSQKAKQGKLSESTAKPFRKASGGDQETRTIKSEGEITKDVPRSEDNAPMPVGDSTSGSKRKLESNAEDPSAKQIKLEDAGAKSTKSPTPSPSKAIPGRKIRSATSNGSQIKQDKGKGPGETPKITNFFTK